jgi:hypothetical protein
MITEHLMRPGTGSFQLRSDTPAEITNLIGDLIGAAGVGCELIITPTRLNSTAIGDAAILAQALYAGEITERESRTQYQLAGLASLLDGVNTAVISRTAGTPAQWVGDIDANGLTVGTGTGGSNVTRTFPRLAQTRREILDAVAALGGWEWDISPAGAINYGTALFQSPPTVVITDDDAGPDGTYIGLQGGILGHGINASTLASAVYVVGSGIGAATVEGSASQTLARKGRAGGTLTLPTTISAPAEGSDTNAGALASAVLTQRTPRYSVDVSSQTRHTRRKLRAGDEVYLWSIRGGLADPSIQIRFRGQIITPALVRCLTITWPIERGYGLYIRTNAASPTYTDITRYIEWEDPGTWLEVGSWAPPSYGVTGRSNPQLEERFAGDIGPARILLTRTTAMSIGNGGGGTTVLWGNNESYVRHFGATFKAASDDSITIPAGLGGDYLVTFSGQFAANATGVRQLTVTIGSNTGEPDELAAINDSRPAQGTLPNRLTASAVVALDAGATLTASAYQNSGGALDLTDMRFSAVRLGSQT